MNEREMRLRDIRKEINHISADLVKYGQRLPEWDERLRARIAELDEEMRALEQGAAE